MLNFIHFYYSTNDKLYSSYSIFLKLLSTEILRVQILSCTSRSANHSRYLAVRLKFKLSVFIFF
ncbi:unnamed protein product [Oikopleura dioica]|uniref:Uncharacterized protein n=1 Tax=Oikopleura dioica TaxID=34765 RepID=E4YI34_OIKDI|nr:unnamed protein product [Oikopleura dioica]